MPIEQVGTPFSNGDQLDLHTTSEHVAPYSADLSAADAALDREKRRSEEFLNTAHGQIYLLGQHLEQLRRWKADTERPLDPRQDLGMNQGYEVTE